MRSRLLKILKIVVIIVISLPLLLLVYSFMWFLYGPETKTSTVTSPNGQYSAYVGTRGVMDSINRHLYISTNRSRPKPVVRVGSRYVKDIRWSPDSRKLAIIDRNLSSVEICLYDVRTGKYRENYVKTGIDGGSLSQEDYAKADWVWANSNTIMCVLRDNPSSPDNSPRDKVIGIVKVNDNGPELKAIAMPNTELNRTPWRKLVGQ